MKDGLKWSDGTELTAKDVEYSWQRLANPDTGADYAYLTTVIKTKDDGTLDVAASEDGKTFTVNLVAPCAYILFLRLISKALKDMLRTREHGVQKLASYPLARWFVQDGSTMNP